MPLLYLINENEAVRTVVSLRSSNHSQISYWWKNSCTCYFNALFHWVEWWTIQNYKDAVCPVHCNCTLPTHTLQVCSLCRFVPWTPTKRIAPYLVSCPDPFRNIDSSEGVWAWDYSIPRLISFLCTKSEPGYEATKKIWVGMRLLIVCKMNCTITAVHHE